jgi:HTH-type transcriptional regulator, competence development regulator
LRKDKGGSVPDQSLGVLLHEARVGHDLSLSEVASRAGCSPGYVHKLEADRVHTPSPRVLAGLASALAVPYVDLMAAAGYDEQPSNNDAPTTLPSAVKRYSNAHIVELLEALRRDVDDLRSTLESQRAPGPS